MGWRVEPTARSCRRFQALPELRTELVLLWPSACLELAGMGPRTDNVAFAVNVGAGGGGCRAQDPALLAGRAHLSAAALVAAQTLHAGHRAGLLWPVDAPEAGAQS